MPANPLIERARAVDRHPVRLALVAAVAVAALLVSTATGATASDSRPTSLGEVLEPVQASASQLTGALVDQPHSVAVATLRLLEELTPPPPACPAPGSEFIDSWGFRRSGGRRHKGVDMMAPHGTPVLAPVAGTVRESSSRLGGIGFYLDDAEGNTYFGSHLASLDHTGWVEAGTQIGTVGSTGNASASGPHLHFEVMAAGRGSVNPYPYAAEWCRDPVIPGLDPALADVAPGLDLGLADASAAVPGMPFERR